MINRYRHLTKTVFTSMITLSLLIGFFTVPVLAKPNSETKTPVVVTKTKVVVYPLTLVSMTTTVTRGTYASVKILGKPKTAYSINVYYTSKPSTVSGLQSQISDTKGYITWKWKVDSKTAKGKYKIVIIGDSKTLTLYFTVK